MDRDKNILDLRPKIEPEIRIVEKIVVQKKKLPIEFLKLVVIVVISSLIIWGISRADNLNEHGSSSISQAPQAKNFSVMGIVSEIASSSISMTNMQGGDADVSSYSFDTKYIDKIESNHFVPMNLSDINVGDRIIAQGVEVGINGRLVIRRVVSFGTSDETEITLTVATSTLDLATTTVSAATSTIDVATTTPDASTDASATSTNDVPRDEATSTPQVLGTSTTTDETSSTTDDAEDITPDVGTSTPPNLGGVGASLTSYVGDTGSSTLLGTSSSPQAN